MRIMRWTNSLRSLRGCQSAPTPKCSSRTNWPDCLRRSAVALSCVSSCGLTETGYHRQSDEGSNWGTNPVSAGRATSSAGAKSPRSPTLRGQAGSKPPIDPEQTRKPTPEESPEAFVSCLTRRGPPATNRACFSSVTVMRLGNSLPRCYGYRRSGATAGGSARTPVTPRGLERLPGVDGEVAAPAPPTSVFAATIRRELPADRGAGARGEVARAELTRTRYEASALHRRPGDGRCLGVTLDREVIHTGIPVRALVDDPA